MNCSSFIIHHSAFIISYSLPQETDVRGRDATDEGEDRREVCVGDAVPARKCRRILIHSGRRYPSPAPFGVVGFALVWFECVSKPPKVQKKICRWRPNEPDGFTRLALINLAICFN